MDGDPPADIDLLADADRNMLVIMKDGKIFENMLPGSQRRVTSMDDSAARMEAIETKLAFQEDLLQQLHVALVAQQSRIDQLEAMLELLVERQSAGDGDSQDLPEPPPPHY